MNLVEARIGTTGEETVELVIIKKMTLIKARFAYLYKKKQVRVLALWCCAVTLLDVVGCNIDTLHMYEYYFCERRGRRVHHLGCCRTRIFAAGVV